MYSGYTQKYAGMVLPILIFFFSNTQLHQHSLLGSHLYYSAVVLASHFSLSKDNVNTVANTIEKKVAVVCFGLLHGEPQFHTVLDFIGSPL